MSDKPQIFEYSSRQPLWRRRSVWLWVVVPVVVLVVLAAVGFMPSRSWETYIDINSGDLMTTHSIGSFCYRKEIVRTPFSNAIRKYLGPPPPAKWVYCFGKVGTFNAAYEDGAEGYWPSECAMMMKTIELVPVTDAEMKSLMMRCAGCLANDQRQAMENETNSLIDRATTRP